MSILTDKQLEEMADDVRNGLLTFRAIGDKYGVSGQRVAQLNENRFKVHARTRAAQRTMMKHREAENKLVISHYPAPTRIFIKKATQAGLKVLPYIAYGRDTYIEGIPTTALKVNSKICSIHVSTSEHSVYKRKDGGSTSYYSFNFGEDRRWKELVPEYYILIAALPKRFFIIPKAFLKLIGKSRTRVYIPVEPGQRNHYNNRKPKTEYLDFENRFDLLK